MVSHAGGAAYASRRQALRSGSKRGPPLCTNSALLHYAFCLMATKQPDYLSSSRPVVLGELRLVEFNPVASCLVKYSEWCGTRIYRVSSAPYSTNLSRGSTVVVLPYRSAHCQVLRNPACHLRFPQFFLRIWALCGRWPRNAVKTQRPSKLAPRGLAAIGALARASSAQRTFIFFASATCTRFRVLQRLISD